MSRNLSCSFLLYRSCVRNIFHGNALAGFFSVVVSVPKARQFQIPYKLIVYAEMLGETVQRFADVLEKELKAVE